MRPEEIESIGSRLPEIRLAFHSGLGLLERRIGEALAPLADRITVKVIGRVPPAEVRWADHLGEARLLIVGPDIPFEEALAAARAARAAASEVPILFLREEFDVPHVRAAAEAGARGYVLMPFDAAKFRVQVEKVLARSPLAGAPVREIMGPADTVREAETVGAVARKLVERNLTGVVVVDVEGRSTGFVSARDLLAAFRLRGASALGVPVRDLMNRRLISVEEEASLDAAVDLFVRHGLRVLPVLRKGRPIGVLRRTEALRAVLEAEGG